MPYVPPTSHVTLLAALRRERLLPVAGEVIVREGQRAETGDVVATAVIPDFHRLVNVARELGLPPAKADACLLKQEGDTVKKGELIAERRGLFGREVASMVDGQLLLAGGGKILLASISKQLELRAGLPGTVATVIERRGVVIEMVGALLEGVWGNGADALAVLRVMGNTPADVLLSKQVDVGLRGMIIAGGVLADAADLQRLAEVQVRGLIVGSMRAALMPLAQKVNFPVLVVEGFGAQGFSVPAFTLLSSNNGREIWANAQTWNRLAGHRPEAILPLPSSGQMPPPPADGEALAVGTRVRVLRGPAAGRVGKVAALKEQLEFLPSGVRARTALMVMENAEGKPEGKPVSLPFANLEILG